MNGGATTARQAVGPVGTRGAPRAPRPRGDRRGPALVAALFVALVATAAVVAGCDLAFTNSASAEETIVRSVDLAIWSMSPQIDVETFNGNVTITAGTGASAEVTVVKRASAPTKDEANALLGEVDVAVEDRGSARVLVRASRGTEPAGGATSGADVTITVPGHSAVSVQTTNGTVRVEGVVGPVAVRSTNGTVTVAAGGADTEVYGTDVQTSNADVTVTGPARDVKATTSNARIRIEGARGSIDVETSNGPITIDAEDAVVTARTTDAYVTFAGSLAAGDHRLETSNGTVTLDLPPAASFHLSAKTSGGGVLSQFPLTPTPPANATAVDATAGEDPRAALTIVTSNGDVKLQKAK